MESDDDVIEIHESFVVQIKKVLPIPVNQIPDSFCSDIQPSDKQEIIDIADSSSNNDSDNEDDSNSTAMSTSGESDSSGSSNHSNGSGKTYHSDKSDSKSDTFVVDLTTDEEVPVPLNEDGKMECDVCHYILKNKTRFLIHLKRHFALDHFICSTCFKGFVNFHQCRAHELKEHRVSPAAITPKTSESTDSQSLQNILNKGVVCGTVGDEEMLAKHVVTSCSILPYRGPTVTGPYDASKIEVKYSRGERVSYALQEAKNTLKCQEEIRKTYGALLDVPATTPKVTAIHGVTRFPKPKKPILRARRKPGKQRKCMELGEHVKIKKSPDVKIVTKGMTNSRSKKFRVYPIPKCDNFAKNANNIRKHECQQHPTNRNESRPSKAQVFRKVDTKLRPLPSRPLSSQNEPKPSTSAQAMKNMFRYPKRNCVDSSLTERDLHIQ